MSRSLFPPLLSLALAGLVATPASLSAQSTERSIERMAENIAAAAERLAARVEKHATIMADRLERKLDGKRWSDEDWDWDDDEGRRARRDSAWQQGRTSIDTTVAFSPDGTIDLSNLAGEIIVTGWSRRDAHIKATSERGRLALDVTSSRLTLEEERRGSSWGSNRRGDTRYEVSVPRGVRVMVRSTSGNITVRGAGGEVEASSTSGDVEVHDATRRIELNSVSGDVIGRQLKGRVEVNSVSGSVELDDVEGDLHAGTTSGDVILRGVVSRDIEASTTSGEVTFSGDLATDGRYEFHSHSGNVQLTIPAAVNARFSLETFSGSLESDFPITLQPGDRAMSRPRRFEFTVGNGGARVIAETFSGDLEIRKR